MSKTAIIYPGTFDPITNGHLNLIERAQALFGEVIVAIAEGSHKKTIFSLDEREALANTAIKHLPNVRVKTFHHLLVDFATEQNCHMILRGVRGTDDWEYEKQLAFMNAKLKPDVETVFMLPDPNFQHIASSLVKDIARHGGDISAFVPDFVADALKRK